MRSSKSKRNYIKAKLNYFDFIQEMLINKLLSEIRIPDFVEQIVELHEENEMSRQPTFKELVFHLKDVKEEGYLWWKKRVAYYVFVGRV